MILVMSNSATAEDTKDPATDLIKVELFQSYPWKYLFIKPYIEAVVNDFNVTAPRYEPFDNMLRSDIMITLLHREKKRSTDNIPLFF